MKVPSDVITMNDLVGVGWGRGMGEGGGGKEREREKGVGREVWVGVGGGEVEGNRRGVMEVNSGGQRGRGETDARKHFLEYDGNERVGKTDIEHDTEQKIINAITINRKSVRKDPCASAASPVPRGAAGEPELRGAAFLHGDSAPRLQGVHRQLGDHAHFLPPEVWGGVMGGWIERAR